MYSVPHSQQLSIFLTSLGVGFILGIFYDILRAVRLSITKNKKACVFFDILYFIVTAIASFIFILAANKGEIRFYIIAGEIIGWAFYYLSFGIAVVKFTDKLVSAFRSFCSLIFRVITLPFRAVIRLIKAIIKKSSPIFKKTEKKSSKMRKKVLQKLHLYVYNLFGVFCAKSKKHSKGGNSDGKEQKAQ
ncbi:MAG: hypothetical protein E7533_07055 [Ruminococcaceae bacterium]|nr:hypothetical protein [Oscillospiraceae bacterium]